MSNYVAYAPKPQSTFTPAPAGQHKAILYGFIDIGTQPTTDRDGNAIQQRQVILQFELHGSKAPLVDGKPPAWQKYFKFSMHEKATLRKVVEALTDTVHHNNVYGDGINAAEALGKCCTLQLVEAKKQDGSTTTKMGGILPLDAELTKPEQVNPTRFFSLDAFNPEVFETFPQKLQETIMRSPEYAAAVKGVLAAVTDAVDENFPFDNE
jgi:hypothetical protein